MTIIKYPFKSENHSDILFNLKLLKMETSYLTIKTIKLYNEDEVLITETQHIELPYIINIIHNHSDKHAEMCIKNKVYKKMVDKVSDELNFKILQQVCQIVVEGEPK